MYTNIDTNTGTTAIQNFLTRKTYQSNIPMDILPKILEIFMNNNIFNFSDTFWLQLSGTAMETPVACN